jgi:hypothetical protein
MAQNGLSEIISRLEVQRRAIENALEALRGLDGITDNGTTTPAGTVGSGPARRKGGMTPEGRKRLSAALRKRWAAKKAAQPSATETAAPTETPAKKKNSISPAGRRRLAEAMKRRWAVKRAASSVKQSGRRKAAKAAA